jgi:hypothetical protein
MSLSLVSCERNNTTVHVLSPWEFVQCTASPQLVSYVMPLCHTEIEEWRYTMDEGTIKTKP